MLYDEVNYDYGSAATADYFLVGEHAAGGGGGKTFWRLFGR